MLTKEKVMGYIHTNACGEQENPDNEVPYPNPYLSRSTEFVINRNTEYSYKLPVEGSNAPVNELFV